MNGANTLSTLKKKWQFIWFTALVLPALGAGLLVAALAKMLAFSPVWVIPAALVVLVILLFSARPWLLAEPEVARIIDRENPQTEESAALLLREPAAMNLLEQLQAGRVQEQLAGIRLPRPLKRIVQVCALVMLALFAVAFLLMNISFNHTPQSRVATPAQAQQNQKPENILPAITSVSVAITPPAYTHRPARNQARFGFSAEKGAQVKWNIGTNVNEPPVLIFNGREKLKMRAANNGKTQWLAEKKAGKNGFYQVQIGGKLSELYPIEVIPDQAPVVKIVKPASYTTIDFGQPQQSLLQVQMSDDYGLADAVLITTLASGKGESVKFKEEKSSLADVKGRRSASVQKLLDLKKRGMQPGDELYFFISARDSRQQQTRSDVYIISIADTAELMSMSGLVSGVNLVPEYFRSQRQIIIETEALIKARDTISSFEHDAKSNDLGFDQKVLRLRYGKFLGEEAESGQPHVHDNGQPASPAVFGDAKAIMEPYMHKHDNAEDATFFEPEQKQHLKDVLNEMWKAELRLRTFKPQEALPFEYKALRLLKDLQQSQRAYVAKTAYTPPPIKPEKRLSGELNEISQPLADRKVEADFTTENSLRQAASVLSSLQAKTTLAPTDTKALQTALTALRRKATEKPAAYLPAVSALQKILDGKRSMTGLRTVQAAIKDLLPAKPALPQSSATTAAPLSDQYFKHLNQQRK